MMLEILYQTWHVLETAGPFILFGFLASGLIHTFIPQAKIVSLLGRRNVKSVLMASLCGIALPLCSCAVLPTAATLRKKGASRGAATSFLISTPETRVDSIALTYGLMDLPMTILRPLAAFCTAFIAGLAVNAWGERDTSPEPDPLPDTNCSCHTMRRSWWRETLHYAFVELIDDLAIWLALGFLLSGCLAALVPESWLTGWVGQGVTSILVMLAVSMPMYICASASTPIAAVLVAKGLSPGAAVAFLLAGPATNLASLPVLARILGKRSLALYLLSIFFMSLLIGIAVNQFYHAHWVIPHMAVSDELAEQPNWLKRLSGLLLLALLLKGLWKWIFSAKGKAAFRILKRVI